METIPRGTRPGDIAEVSLREMVAHLNVIEAAIDAMSRQRERDTGAPTRDLLNRLDLLAFCAARLRIADIPRVTDALSAVVLSAHVPPYRIDDIAATLRHGVDVLMLLTHDKMRRMQGYPAAELRPSIDALLSRVDRVTTDRPAIPPPV